MCIYICIYILDCSAVDAECIECTGETADTDCTVCNDGFHEDSGDCTG